MSKDVFRVSNTAYVSWDAAHKARRIVLWTRTLMWGVPAAGFLWLMLSITWPYHLFALVPMGFVGLMRLLVWDMPKIIQSYKAYKYTYLSAKRLGVRDE